MAAKRTLREIKRQNQMLTLIVEASKKQGPGQNRAGQFMALVKNLKEFKALPAWRQAYVTGYAEGASMILALLDAHIVEGVLVSDKPTTRPPARPSTRAPRVMKTLVPPPPESPEDLEAPSEAPAPRVTVPPPASEAPASPSVPPDMLDFLTRLKGVLESVPTTAVTR